MGRRIGRRAIAIVVVQGCPAAGGEDVLQILRARGCEVIIAVIVRVAVVAIRRGMHRPGVVAPVHGPTTVLLALVGVGVADVGGGARQVGLQVLVAVVARAVTRIVGGLFVGGCVVAIRRVGGVAGIGRQAGPVDIAVVELGAVATPPAAPATGLDLIGVYGGRCRTVTGLIPSSTSPPIAPTGTPVGRGKSAVITTSVIMAGSRTGRITIAGCITKRSSAILAGCTRNSGWIDARADSYSCGWSRRYAGWGSTGALTRTLCIVIRVKVTGFAGTAGPTPLALTRVVVVRTRSNPWGAPDTEEHKQNRRNISPHTLTIAGGGASRKYK